MHPEEKHGLTTFHYQTEEGEMVELEAGVREIQINPSYDSTGVSRAPRGGSATATFKTNVRKLSPTLARYFKRVNALGYVYIDKVQDLL